MTETARYHPTVTDTPNDQVGSNNGTYNGGMTTSTTGEPTVGGSRHYLFDGTNDYIAIPDSTDFSGGTALTISAWVYSSTAASQTGIVFSQYGAAGDRAWYLAIVGGVVRLLVSSDGTAVTYRDSAASLSNSTWHFIAGIYTPSSMDTYIDGSVSNGSLTGSIPSSVHNTTAAVAIGRRDWSSSYLYYTGRADKLRFYQSALSAGTISTNYAEQRAAVGGATGARQNLLLMGCG